MTAIELHATTCAICETAGNSTEVYSANFSISDLSPGTFSARRLPDKIRYRIVRCNTCGLVRSDPIVDPHRVQQLYARSTLALCEEHGNLKATYGHYLARLAKHKSTRDTLLEIGCANGSFLEEALTQG